MLFACICLATALAVGPPQGFLHLPVSRKPASTLGGLQRRHSDDLAAGLTYNRSLLSIDLDLGTPPQRMSLLLSTASSDTVVLEPAACPKALNCSHEDAIGHEGCLWNPTCPQASIFDRNHSSTFRQNHTETLHAAIMNPDGMWTRGDGPASGIWAQDALRLGAESLDNFNFVVATDPLVRSSGVLGVGLPNAHRHEYSGDVPAYANLPLQLKQKGIIQHAAYSLWLDPAAADPAAADPAKAGSLLFGAIDASKFITNLYTMPLVVLDGYDHITRLAVHLTGLSIYNASGAEQQFLICDVPVVLDTSSPASSLPSSFFQPFYAILNVFMFTWGYLAPCDALTSQDGGLGIQLGGVDVTVGFSDLFVPVDVFDETGVQYCVPGFTEADPHSGPYVIGENILKTLYVVYDLENLEVAIAAAHTGAANATASIQALSTGIPGTRADKSLKSTVRKKSRYTTADITLISPSVSRAPDMATRSGIYTHSASPAQGILSVTHSIVIGARANAQSTKISDGSAAAAPRRSLLAACAGLLLSWL